MRVAASQYTNVLIPLVYWDGNPLGSEVVLLLTEFLWYFGAGHKLCLKGAKLCPGKPRACCLIRTGMGEV